MAALVHHPLTKSHAFPAGYAAARPGLTTRIGDTLHLWQRRMRERQELARLSDRELRDMRASHADVWRESNEWFWRPGRLS